VKKPGKTTDLGASKNSGGVKFSKRDYIRVVPLHYPSAQKGEKNMKKPSKIGTPTTSEKTVAPKFSKGEYIRVVPLHYPKPTIPLKELNAQKRARESGKEIDLFDGVPHIGALAGAHLKYFNGPLIPNVEVFTLFWGEKWNSSTATALRTKLNAFFTAILVSPAIDQLAEYNVPGQKIGHGKLIGTKVITANAPVGSITDTAIQSRLTKWITAKTVPPTTKNTLYFIYLEPGIVSIMGGSKSCQSYCGYHNNKRKVYYAVMPYPSCSGCLGGLSVINALTGTSSHELCEAITDPVPGSGWYDHVNGEIGDICAWKFKKVDGYNVQLEWSNMKNKCV
jgi:hypothetical protein